MSAGGVVPPPTALADVLIREATGCGHSFRTGFIVKPTLSVIIVHPIYTKLALECHQNPRYQPWKADKI
jgi:hypothetical protein